MDVKIRGNFTRGIQIKELRIRSAISVRQSANLSFINRLMLRRHHAIVMLLSINQSHNKTLSNAHDYLSSCRVEEMQKIRDTTPNYYYDFSNLKLHIIIYSRNFFTSTAKDIDGPRTN